MKISFLSFFILLFGHQAFLACDCFEYPTHRKEFAKSSAVFIGEVVKLEVPNAEARQDFPDDVRNSLGDLITLKIIKAWKGPKTGVHAIWEHASFFLCSKWKFKLGEKYLIYANKANGVLIGANFCSRTRPLETTDKAQLKEFKKLDSFWFRFRSYLPFP
jgi:hypothetical protein